MDRITHAAVLLCTAALALGCTERTPQPPAVDLAAEEQAIRDLSAGWKDMMNARDYDGIAALYAADIAAMFDGEIFHGADAMRAHLEQDWGAMPDAVVDWTASRIVVAGSGDMAYEVGSFSFDPDGAGEGPARSGEYVTVWRKIDGGRKVVTDTGTMLPAEGEAAGG